MIRPFRGTFNLTQGFGQNPASYAKFGLKGHNGLDYGLPSNTQVIAPHGGKVIEVTNDPNGYGNYLKIENSVEGSVLAHLASFQVKVGDIVSEGQPIALSDNTGNSTGPHLHFGYYKFPRNRQNGYAGFIDQLNLISMPAETPPTLEGLAKEVGYNPTFEGQDVTKDGVHYKAIKKDGKLVWKTEPQEDWKKKYEDELQVSKALAATADLYLSKINKAQKDLA